MSSEELECFNNTVSLLRHDQLTFEAYRSSIYSIGVTMRGERGCVIYLTTADDYRPHCLDGARYVPYTDKIREFTYDETLSLVLDSSAAVPMTLLSLPQGIQEHSFADAYMFDEVQSISLSNKANIFKATKPSYTCREYWLDHFYQWCNTFDIELESTTKTARFPSWSELGRLYEHSQSPRPLALSHYDKQD